MWAVIKAIALSLPELLKLLKAGWVALMAWRRAQREEKAREELAAAIAKAKLTGDTSGVEDMFNGKK